MSSYNIPVEFIDKLNELRDIIYKNNIAKGWYNQPKHITEAIEKLEVAKSGYLTNPDVRNALDSALSILYNTEPKEFGTCIALMHSELSEALEGHRKGLMDSHLPNRSSPEVELADAVIRIFDTCGHEGYDIGGAIYEKFCYNQTREDHKKEVREREGGKKY